MSETQAIESNQYLSFQLNDEEFGIDICKVREVLDYTKLTTIPKMPEFMRGVINLRGSVVPVVDLKRKFGMDLTVKTVNTRIIIGEIEVDGETAVLGALADAVHEVMEIDPASIEPAPKIGTRLNTEFIKGIGKRNEDFLMILNFDRVFSVEELTEVSSTAGKNDGVHEKNHEE